MLGRGLLKEFPNPQRVGCPGADVLKRIAAHKMPLSEAEKWLDHLGSCSPCYADFCKFRTASQQARRRTWLAVAASILLVGAIGGWAFLHKRNENLVAQRSVLDLRDRSIARGTEPNPSEAPLELSRSVSHIEIYLPLGSGDGAYGVRISGPGQKILFATSAVASMQRGTTSIGINVNLSSARPGLYVLQLQKSGAAEWTSYPLRVR